LFRAGHIQERRRGDRRPRTLDDEIGEGLEFAQAVAEATGTPVAELDVLLADPGSAPQTPALGDPLERLARHYAVQAGALLQSAGLNRWDGPGGPQGAPLSVIAWYHVMIAAKTYRALVSAHQSAHGAAALRADANGSAKVALLAIDRSTAALHLLAEREDDARLGGLIELLDTLRFAIERRFPEARAFERPGLDSGRGFRAPPALPRVPRPPRRGRAGGG
jgi:hypothetical protein